MQTTSATIDSAAVDRPSLYDLLSDYSPLPQNISQDYQHQSLPFTYTMSVVAERSMKEDVAEAYPSPMCESQNVFVAITQSEQVGLGMVLDGTMCAEGKVKGCSKFYTKLY